jgi:PEP-CTERM motif
MRKFFAAALGSVVALAGFAGAANASATIDLIWIDVSDTNLMGNPKCLLPTRRDCPSLGTTLSTVVNTDNISLAVIFTPGPLDSIGVGVSVDYSEVLGQLGVIKFQSLITTLPKAYLPLLIGSVTDQSPFIDNIGAVASPPTGSGIGLPSGVSAYIGTVSFHKDATINGTFEIAVGTTGNTDGVLDGNGVAITNTSTFNSAFLVNVPEPGALSLLVMGVGGMLLAGRGRRS